MSLLRMYVLAALSVALGGAVAQAQDPPPQARRTEDLRAELDRRRAATRALEARLHALEEKAADESEGSEVGAGESEGVKGEDGLEETLFGLYDEVNSRLDLLPTLAGYLDVEYFNDDQSDSPGEFRQHRLSLHLSKEYDSFRFFSEVEFEYGTHFESGGLEAGAGADGAAELEEARGELNLEQAWAEYMWRDELTLRAGLILTPGHWNVNHYPTVVLPTRRPLLVHRIYPQSFTGVMAYGTHYWGGFGVTYRAYAGNGENPGSARDDANEAKALGTRWTVHLPVGGPFERFDLGVSGFADDPPDARRTRTWGLDAQIAAGHLELLSEFATRRAEEDREGFYVQPSWRFDDSWAVFYRHDRFRVEGGDRVREHTLGVNYRPIAPVSLKGELFRSGREHAEDATGLALSLAIAF